MKSKIEMMVVLIACFSFHAAKAEESASGYQVILFANPVPTNAGGNVDPWNDPSDGVIFVAGQAPIKIHCVAEDAAEHGQNIDCIPVQFPLTLDNRMNVYPQFFMQSADSEAGLVLGKNLKQLELNCNNNTGDVTHGVTCN